MRVVRYDREGKWFSESSKETFTPEFYARQLHILLEISGEKPPYILVGHSLGGIYNRIFRDIYPNEVKAMVFIDSSHPEQWKRLDENGLIEKNQIGFCVYFIWSLRSLTSVLLSFVNSVFVLWFLFCNVIIRTRANMSKKARVMTTYTK